MIQIKPYSSTALSIYVCVLVLFSVCSKPRWHSKQIDLQLPDRPALVSASLHVDSSESLVLWVDMLAQSRSFSRWRYHPGPKQWRTLPLPIKPAGGTFLFDERAKAPRALRLAIYSDETYGYETLSMFDSADKHASWMDIATVSSRNKMEEPLTSIPLFFFGSGQPIYGVQWSTMNRQGRSLTIKSNQKTIHKFDQLAYVASVIEPNHRFALMEGLRETKNKRGQIESVLYLLDHKGKPLLQHKGQLLMQRKSNALGGLKQFSDGTLHAVWVGDGGLTYGQTSSRSPKSWTTTVLGEHPGFGAQADLVLDKRGRPYIILLKQNESRTHTLWLFQVDGSKVKRSKIIDLPKLPYTTPYELVGGAFANRSIHLVYQNAHNEIYHLHKKVCASCLLD